jgi:glycogen debranching enzyme
MTNFVRIVNSSGIVDGWGDVPTSQIPMQAREGTTILECGPDTVQKIIVDGRTAIDVNLDWLKQALRAMVDQQSGNFRLRFITDIPGQSQVYQKKESEATAWTPGDELINPDRYPFMLAESSTRGISVSQVREEILAQVAYYSAISSKIESTRVASKQKILNAVDIPSAISASIIDWEHIIT